MIWFYIICMIIVATSMGYALSNREWGWFKLFLMGVIIQCFGIYIELYVGIN